MVADFGKRKKKSIVQSLFSMTLIGVLTIGAIGFLVYSNIKISQKRARLTEQLQALKEQVRDLEQRKRDLEAGVSFQESEEYLEEIARERLNLKAEGEEVVAFVAQEVNKADEQEESRGLMDRILEKLKFW